MPSLIAPAFPMVVNFAFSGVSSCAALASEGNLEEPRYPARTMDLPRSPTYPMSSVNINFKCHAKQAYIDFKARSETGQEACHETKDMN